MTDLRHGVISRESQHVVGVAGGRAVGTPFEAILDQRRLAAAGKAVPLGSATSDAPVHATVQTCYAVVAAWSRVRVAAHHRDSERETKSDSDPDSKANPRHRLHVSSSAALCGGRDESTGHARPNRAACLWMRSCWRARRCTWPVPVFTAVHGKRPMSPG